MCLASVVFTVSGGRLVESSVVHHWRLFFMIKRQSGQLSPVCFTNSGVVIIQNISG